ncbi:hypothetical protein evm_000312 [Chilo suppressalis]|nr:hypothetical protein evm_000312 [Chilo suppressalis]
MSCGIIPCLVQLSTKENHTALNRSYKYMNFASKMPSLRIDQNDLKCKNGCDYYGNPQWQGYCSKCHREQMLRQRRAEKASSNPSATLPRPEQKKPERGTKQASHSSFSKFEEKRLRQSETLAKKANLLKFSVFKKSSTDDHDHSERRAPEFKVPPMVNEGMKRDFRTRFPTLGAETDRDARVFVHSFIMDVMKCANVMSVDELSERVQRLYQVIFNPTCTALYAVCSDQDSEERSQFDTSFKTLDPFDYSSIGRLGRLPTRGPSADWRVLTTADAAGTNGLTCLPKHGDTRD